MSHFLPLTEELSKYRHVYKQPNNKPISNPVQNCSSVTVGSNLKGMNSSLLRPVMVKYYGRRASLAFVWLLAKTIMTWYATERGKVRLISPTLCFWTKKSQDWPLKGRYERKLNYSNSMTCNRLDREWNVGHCSSMMK